MKKIVTWAVLLGCGGFLAGCEYVKEGASDAVNRAAVQVGEEASEMVRAKTRETVGGAIETATDAVPVDLTGTEEGDPEKKEPKPEGDKPEGDKPEENKDGDSAEKPAGNE